MRFSLFAAVGAACLLAGCATTQTASAPEPPLATESFTALKPSKVRTLVVIVHDDLRNGAPVDYADFAQQAATATQGAAVVVMRPGYGDADGPVSPGVRPRDIGDGYGPGQVQLLGQSVQALRARYRHARTILVGHGGGAVLAANLAATRPLLVDAMLLVGCPCALPEWRRHMARRDRAFAEPVDSLDPLQTVGGIAPTARVGIVVGNEKARVPARIARLYAEALALRGIAVDYRQVDGSDGELLKSNDVIQLLARLSNDDAQGDSRP
ncbi:alpha/beta fold hydrolase [Sphingomonas sp. IW22]|uniref:alpha/beta fold hydrolase n=1 Tax=Sphingomonas sp. IW22 TaxID=3242489 RepID=UPI0035230FF9